MLERNAAINKWHSRGRRFDPAWLHQPSRTSAASVRKPNMTLRRSERRLPRRRAQASGVKYAYILQSTVGEHFCVGAQL